jgi:hypothetical protein
MPHTDIPPAAPSAAPAFLFLLVFFGPHHLTSRQPFPLQLSPNLAPTFAYILTYGKILADPSAAFFFHGFAVGFAPVQCSTVGDSQNHQLS